MVHSNKKDWFSNWFNTNYYHILYAHRDNSEAETFIKNIIKKLNIPEKSNVLDVACGNGRHARILSNYNLNVWGIDIAENNIAEAKVKSSSNIFFEVFDMRNTYKKEYFDYVFNIFTSFGYFENDDENFAAIKAITENLKSNGLFIFDYLNPVFVEKTLVAEEKISRSNIDFIIKREINNKRIIKNINVIDNGNAYSFKEDVSLYTQKELKYMLENAGLEIKAEYGNYELNTFNELDSSRIILIAKKI
jgi:SAM-dependent methyltransferase